MIDLLPWRKKLSLVALCFASVLLPNAGGDDSESTSEFRAIEGKLEKFPYTCGMPLEENQSLEESIAGKMITSRLFDQMQEIPMAVGQSCGSICMDIKKDQQENGGTFGAFFPVNDCIRACERKAPDSVNRSIQLCEPKINRSHHCAGIPPGRYCLVAKPKDSVGEECLVLDSQFKTAKEFVCPGGFYCRGAQHAPIVCPKGFSCREGSSESRGCRNGEFCLQSGYPWKCDNERQPDPANGGPPASMRKLLEGTECKRDSSNKIVLPLPCPEGYFCEAGRKFQCPKGHSCVLGSSSPHKCSTGEVCLAGAARALRWPRALMEFGVNLVLMLVVILAPSGKCGACFRNHNLAFGVVAIIGLWVFEFFRSENAWFSHCALITACFTIIAYGGFIGPKCVSKLPVVNKLAARSRLFVDYVLFMCGMVFLWLVVGMFDRYTTLMFSLFLPVLYMCRKCNAEMSATPIPQALVSAIGSIVLFIILHILDPLTHHGNTFFLFGFIVLPELVRYIFHRLTQTSDERAKIQEIHQNYLVFHEQHHARFRDRDDDVDEDFKLLADSLGAVELGGLRGARSTKCSPSPESCKPNVPSDVGRISEEPESPDPQTGRRKKSFLSPFLKESSMNMDDGFTRGIGITLENMSLFLPNGAAILRDISLTIPAISTMAVMGPSGSGKSSIMNVLSGRAGYGMVTGKIIVNGDPDGVSLEQLVHVTGFVPQDDVMHRSLTVLENIHYQAKLRLPVSKRVTRHSWAREMASEMVSMMGLSHVENSLIGDESERGISGGQRKRVSIGMELVAKPSLLFLDEPTSGLDSTTSLEVIKIMSQESKKCKCTSLAVIHQPRYETLMIFDHVVLLADGGYLVYAGPTDGVMNYFRAELGIAFPDKANPADVFMDAINLECAKASGTFVAVPDALGDVHTFGKHLASTWERRHAEYSNDPTSAHVLVPNISPQRSSWGECVIAHLERSATQMKRSVRTQMTLSLLLAVGVVIVVTAIPPKKVDNIMTQPLFALFFLMLVQGVAAQRVFGGPERFVAWREAGVGMNMLIYFLGKDLGALAEIYFNSGIFALVYWPLCPLQCSYHTVFWCTFAFIYAVWGMSYIWSISFETSTAQMMSVISSFACFLLAGLQPTFVDLVSVGDGALIPHMSMSPIRFAFGFLMMDHACGAERKSEFRNPYVRFMSRDALMKKGMPLDWVFDNDWGCVGKQAYTYGMELQWAGCSEDSKNPYCKPGEYRPPNGLMCTVSHMYLIGILYRFVALISLLVLSKKHAKGGNSLHGFGRLSRALFYGFVMVFIRVQVANILLFKAAPSTMAEWMVKIFKPWVNTTSVRD